MGWSLSQWQNLDPDERDLWLAYDERRMDRVIDFLDQMKKADGNTAEVVTLIRLFTDLA